jgi:hypothetical protein
MNCMRVTQKHLPHFFPWLKIIKNGWNLLCVYLHSLYLRTLFCSVIPVLYCDVKIPEKRACTPYWYKFFVVCQSHIYLIMIVKPLSMNGLLQRTKPVEVPCSEIQTIWWVGWHSPAHFCDGFSCSQIGMWFCAVM